MTGELEDQSAKFTFLFLELLKHNPKEVLRHLNIQLEPAGFELKMFTVDVQKKYEEARRESLR